MFQLVVRDDNIKFIGERQFVLGFGNTLFNHFVSIGRARNQPVAQFLNRRWLNENSQGFVAVIFFNVAAANYVHIKNNILPVISNPVNFRFQRAVERSGVNFFPLQKFVVLNFGFKLFRLKKIIVFPIGFGMPHSPTGGRYRKFEVEVLIKQMANDGGFACTRRR